MEEFMQSFYFSGYNNLNLYCTKYDDVSKAKAVILVIHGMQEHSGRYAEFAQFLNRNNFIVFCADSRGHGKTMLSPDDYGCGEKDIFAESVWDYQLIIKQIQKEYPTLPLYLFGHSYGSFLSQRLVQVESKIEKVVLCGTTFGNNFSYVSGLILADILTAFGQANKKATAIEKLSLKTWGKKFENGNWLSRDNSVFEAYCADPLCGGSFPISFYRSLFKNMTKVNKTIKNINKNTKILLIVGDADPVGNNAKYVKKLHKLYLKNGISAQMVVYPNARHELINETNKSQVFEDVINFYNS